jgi:hypothetical protein
VGLTEIDAFGEPAIRLYPPPLKGGSMEKHGIPLSESQLKEVRGNLSNVHKHLSAVATSLLKTMGRSGDLSGLEMELHISLAQDKFAREEKDEFIVIRSNLTPVGVYIDPPGVCYPIGQ